MKEKVLAVLKPMLASKGFKKQELEGLADIVAKNLKDDSTEEEINNAAIGIVPYAELMQKVGNRYASEIEKKYEGYVKPSTDKDEPDIKKEEPLDKNNQTSQSLTQEQIQKMIADGIAEGLKPYREKEERTRLQSLLYANEKVKSVPESFRSRYTLDKEDNLEALAAQIETDYASLKQELLKSGEFTAPPQKGAEGGDNDDLISALKAMGEKANNSH